MVTILLILSLVVSQQSAAQSPIYDSLLQRHNRISKTALTVLSAWSLASLTSGIIGRSNSTGEIRQFHRRNILWGGINLGLSGFGFFRMKMESRKRYTDAEVRKKVEATEKTFLFNAGLDLAYMAYGLYTRERGLRHTGDKRDRLRGTGTSLLVQGGFLTLFDAIVYLAHNKNGNRLNTVLDRVTIIATPQGAGLAYRL